MYLPVLSISTSPCQLLPTSSDINLQSGESMYSFSLQIIKHQERYVLIIFIKQPRWKIRSKVGSEVTNYYGRAYKK